MRRFLKNLQTWGLEPEVVVTDGSNLYPTVLAELWPQARHQLCVFHVLKDLHKQVLDAVRRLRRGLARRGHRGHKRKRGRPRHTRRKRPGLTIKEKAAFISKHRYLITQRRDRLSKSDRTDLGTMLDYLPELKTLRTFVDRLQALFAEDQCEPLAWRRHRALVTTPGFLAVPELAAAIEMLAAERFAKMVAFLRSPACRRVRTNNHVERINRKLRHQEKARYKWRSRERSCGSWSCCGIGTGPRSERFAAEARMILRRPIRVGRHPRRLPRRGVTWREWTARNCRLRRVVSSFQSHKPNQTSPKRLGLV